MNKFLSCLALSAMVSVCAYGQSGTNSPYSQYGLGDLSDQGVGINKAMSGVGLAFRKGNEVNTVNPASYSAVDSLSMIVDAGISGQITHYNENGNRLNAKTGGFDYVAALFRVYKHVGVSVGVLPYSNVGYSYSSIDRLPELDMNVPIYYKGKGGLNQVLLGAGWRILKPLSVGVNASFLWGDINRSIGTVNTSFNSLAKEYSSTTYNYKLDFGIQYDQPIGKKNSDFLTIGATLGVGHNLKSDPTCTVMSKNTLQQKSDSTVYEITDGLSLPTTFGVGVAYRRTNVFRVGADFQMQKWGSIDYPNYDATDDGADFVLKSGLLKDSYSLNIGGEWIPRYMSRNFLHRMTYRIGAGFTTPYYYINGKDGPKDFHASLGIGVPIVNGYNNRSVLNISVQWQRRSADELIKENTFRINIGLTFNERWFAKWKVE